MIQAVRSLPQGAYIPVLLDSGVRRGTDVLKALALGECVALKHPAICGNPDAEQARRVWPNL